MTQEQLADASRLHVNHVSYLERSRRAPSLLVVWMLAAGLKLSPAEFVARIEAEIGPVPWADLEAEPSQ